VNLLDPGPIDLDNLQTALSVCGVRFDGNGYWRFNQCAKPATKYVVVYDDSDGKSSIFYCCDELAEMLQTDDPTVLIATYKAAE